MPHFETQVSRPFGGICYWDREDKRFGYTCSIVVLVATWLLEARDFRRQMLWREDHDADADPDSEAGGGGRSNKYLLTSELQLNGLDYALYEPA